MLQFLIDENLPGDLDIWSSENFLQNIHIPDCLTDTDIWKYAIENNLTILTKDTDFYHRYLSTIKTPKVVWFKIGNMKKPEMDMFIISVWKRVEQLLTTERFLIVNKEYIESI